ncbi:di-trans,poly-cis-decaprenylcistransferase [candidate division WOR-1 bacterium RIFOXYB2_FULL_48_7]|uniref:Isoprenyl transferase n=1 Tax=candidate division WOR-1 bacterium RIFOXYB2_FULL_48_7 TaxID=1802583 RepID=A0A1F4TUP3_UNCSA|nr:MAG: di-trans,poly-cis-decaprenylcistransferase [candidate division WOR-1 bacterium RIFOXYB2_FULL_48_7]
MDGNGRWAKQRKLPRAAGHKEGVESLRHVLQACGELGIKYLTVYAFSTENWGRPQEEVDFLMGLFSFAIDREINSLVKNQVRLQFLGRLADFSPQLKKKMHDAMEKTKQGGRITLNVMVNYGGRAELIDAVNEIIEHRTQNANQRIEEQDIQAHLYTRDIPDPDLVIRTASEFRVSNFLLWQIAYAEIYVTPVLWPDFRREQLLAALNDFSKRERRFGKL